MLKQLLFVMKKVLYANRFVLKFFDGNAQEVGINESWVSRTSLMCTKTEIYVQVDLIPDQLISPADFRTITYVKYFFEDEKGEVVDTYTFEVEEFETVMEADYGSSGLLTYQYKIKVKENE